MIAHPSRIHEVDPAPDALVAQALPRIDYRDTIQARLAHGRCADIDTFARRFFLAQPAWLRTVSMNTPSRARMAQTVATTRFAAGDQIGSWRIHDRNGDEIVFGESLGFMQYRFSLRLKRGPADDTVEASSVVQLNGRRGRVYFAVVRLLHKPFVRMMLRNTLRAEAHPGTRFSGQHDQGLSGRNRAGGHWVLRSSAWRVNQIADDFKLLDVWDFAIEADDAIGETFSEFISLLVALGPSTDSRAARALIRLRELLGRMFGWDEGKNTLPIPGCRETSVAERLTEEDRARNQVASLTLPRQQLVDLKGVYLFEDEALFELSNRTVHGLMHFAWVELPGGRHTPQLGVYVKSRGWFGRLYLAAIRPFRHWIVYPAWTGKVAREWRQARAG
jgi:hypothetical protein